jgi:hypothetical protein
MTPPRLRPPVSAAIAAAALWAAFFLLMILLGACALPLSPSDQLTVRSGDPHQEIIDELRWQARLRELEQRRRWRDRNLW